MSAVAPFALHRELVASTDAAPRAWLIMTHGVFGSGGNWRTIARKLVERRPDWGAVLVDLRMHGRSQGAPPPHTLASAAGDLAALIAVLGDEGRAVRAVCGHSFGGKVALAHRGLAGPALAQTWIFDASPSASPGAIAAGAEGNVVIRVLALLEEMPAMLASRDDFTDRLRAAGIDAGVAQWLAQNLERRGDGWALRLELPALRALVTDYYGRDLWPLIERGPGRVFVVAAGRDSALSAEDLARLDALAATGAAIPSRGVGAASAQREPLGGNSRVAAEGLRSVELHRIANAGHWVHVDAPEVVLELLATEL